MDSKDDGFEDAEPVIDTSFDFRSDTPPGRDPDKYSPTLHRYHRLLWSRRLPNGDRFDLVDGRPVNYLVHESQAGTFYLSSDAVIPTFKHKASAVVGQLPPEELEEFDAIGYTMGGMMIFPSNRVGSQMTINGARGMLPRIADRFDLTVECIRRHYDGQHDTADNPLGEVLLRYADFFDLFESFAGYVDFFLLRDLIADDGQVNFFMPFDDFHSPAVPRDVATYREYEHRCIAFIQSRNQRIKEVARSL